MVDAETPKKDNSMLYGAAAGAFFIWAVVVTALLANSGDDAAVETAEVAAEVAASVDLMTGKAGSAFDGTNICHKKKIPLDNIECMIEALDDGANVTKMVVQAGPQAGGNVTKGYNGDLEVDVVPITDQYYQAGLCPVNVHWHLGTEHFSAGEYDCEDGCGPTKINERRKLAGKERLGYQCNLYDADDEKFTKPYEWKYCDKSMEVGQTYEVHWPHSAAGACGTINQYQTPFYDGVFCNLDLETLMTIAQDPQNIASAVGVHGQVFTIVNDEDYYYPNMIRGMIIDPDLEMGTDVAMYTGSTTGTSRNNEICSSYTPVTWQVDRKCHLISASSFDKLCADMMEQRDDMSDDLYAHGSRELVADHLTANNHAN